jgi:hypothetical protein
MTMWNELQKVLDRMFGFEDRVSSQVKKIHQTYDSETGEHVFWFEYRLTAADSPPPTKPDIDVLNEKRIKRNRGNRILDAILDEVLKDYPRQSRS